MNHVLTGLALVIGLSACGRGEPPATTRSEPAVAEPPPPPAVGVYVTNETSGDLTLIDGATAMPVATIKLGKRPRGIAVSPDRAVLYVALTGSPAAGPGVDEKTLPPPDRSADGIGVVDIRQRKLIKVLPSGTDPEQVAVSRDGTRVFVANEDAAELSVVDLKSGNVIATAKTGDEPEGVAIRPDGKVVYVTSEGDGDVAAIDMERLVAGRE